MSSLDPVFAALIQSAVDITHAGRGWIVAVDGRVLRVLAAVGPGAGGLVGQELPTGDGTVGFVIASGQPIALGNRRADDRLLGGMTKLVGEAPSTVLAVPCESDDA